MDNVRRGQRIEVFQNLLTSANEQIINYKWVKKNAGISHFSQNIWKIEVK